MQVVIGVFSVLLSLCSLSTAQVDLRTCGDENSDITCPFFFDKVDKAFRQPSILYTLRKAFFPTAGAPPTLFDIYMTLEIESVPKVNCTDKKYKFGKTPVTKPPTMEDVCKASTSGVKLFLPHSLNKKTSSCYKTQTF